jgi:hypothetical protein
MIRSDDGHGRRQHKPTCAAQQHGRHGRGIDADAVDAIPASYGRPLRGSSSAFTTLFDNYPGVKLTMLRRNIE